MNKTSSDTNPTLQESSQEITKILAENSEVVKKESEDYSKINGKEEEPGTVTDDSVNEVDKQNGIPFRPESAESTREILSSPGDSTDLGLSIETGLETVYIEQKNGTFKPTSTSDLMYAAKQPNYGKNSNKFCIRSALDLAILFQKIWLCLSNFCFGILAGVAALHLIIMFSTLPITRKNVETNIKTVELYSNTAFILPIVFYVCLVICLISLIDRYDTSQLENDDLKDTFSYKFLWMVIVLYLFIFLLHALSAKYDDLFVLYEFDDSFTYPPTNLMAHLEIWRWLDGSKCILCVVGWMLVSLVPSKDFLLHHLKYLKTYDLDSISTP